MGCQHKRTTSQSLSLQTYIPTFLIESSSTEDPIVIPIAKSVQLTLQRNAQKNEQSTNNLVANEDIVITTNGGVLGFSNRQAVKSLQAEVNQKIVDWQNDLNRQNNLINILEELLKADLEALKAGKPPPEDNEDQRELLLTLSPTVAR